MNTVKTLSYNQLASKLKNPNNPVCFMDIQIGNVDVGRISFELFADVAPKTAENFRVLCCGELTIDGIPIGYKGAKFHRVVKDFMVQGGDIINSDGTGITSIYNGMQFNDENFLVKHESAGLLSMANAGSKDTNGCQFFITCAPAEFLNGQHVCFGRVVDGMLVLRKMENITVSVNDRPRIPIVIADCGEL